MRTVGSCYTESRCNGLCVFWGGMPVPLFLLIQTFHSFKKKPKLSLTKILKRVVLPFLLVQTCVIALLCKNGYVCNQLKISVIAGARAWCILLLDLLAVCNIAAVSLSTAVKAEEVKSVNPVLAISERCEVISSVVAIPEPIYRLLCLRYLFLIYLGYEWVRQGIVINWKVSIR